MFVQSVNVRPRAELEKGRYLPTDCLSTWAPDFPRGSQRIALSLVAGCVGQCPGQLRPPVHYVLKSTWPFPCLSIPTALGLSSLVIFQWMILEASNFASSIPFPNINYLIGSIFSEPLLLLLDLP